MTAKEVFDRRYEKYRNLEGKPAIPLEAREMIFAAMEAYAIISNEQVNEDKTRNESVNVCEICNGSGVMKFDETDNAESRCVCKSQI